MGKEKVVFFLGVCLGSGFWANLIKAFALFVNSIS